MVEHTLSLEQAGLDAPRSILITPTIRTKRTILVLVEQADLDGSGTISVEELRKVFDEQPETAEFLKLISGTGRAPPSPEVLLAAMDTDKDGIISLAEFYSFCKNHQGNLDDSGTWPQGVALLVTVSLTVMAAIGVRLLQKRGS